MHILDFSQEIIREIFNYSTNLLQCSLVCKNWNATALQIFYKEVTLDRYRFYITSQQLKLDPDERDGYFKYGSFVKIISFKDSLPDLSTNLQTINTDFGEEAFIRLLECLPNIKELHLGYSNHVSSYLQFILNTESKKCLNHIQVISPSEFSAVSTPSFSIHFKIAYKYRATMANAYLYYDAIKMDIGFSDDTVLTTLGKLTKLTDLTVINTCDDQLTTFDLLEICPKLTHLELQSFKIIPDTIVKKMNDYYINYNTPNHLKSLCITLRTIPLSYVRYIADHLSKQVEFIAICISDAYIHDWIDEIGMFDALRFLTRLGLTKRASFSFNTLGRSEKRLTSYTSRMTNLFRLIHAFRKDKAMYSRIAFYDVEEDDDDFNPQPNYLLDSSKGELDIAYTLELDEYRLRNETGTEQDSFSFDLPDTAISMIGFEIINEVKVTINLSNPMMPYKFLQFAITQCPHLSLFNFSYVNEPFDKFCISTGSKQDKNCLLPITPLQSMKVLTTVDFIPVKSCLDFFSSCFLNIEVFICNCDTGLIEPPHTLEIDITAFKNLKTFGYVLDLISDLDHMEAFVHFVYSDGDEAYYCVNKQSFATVNISTERFLHEHKDMSSKSCVTIKCNKNIKIILGSYFFGIVAEFNNGQLLDYVSITSNLCSENEKQELSYI